MTLTGAASTERVQDAVRKPIGEVVRTAVDVHVSRLQVGYHNDRPDAVAALARIRRGAGKAVNSVPDLWGLTGTELLYTALDERAAPAVDVERAENAVHTAVTLWALHQQSRRDAPMHVSGGPQLGRAVRDLMPTDDIDESIRRRFVRVGTATSFDVLAQRLRDIVLLLRQAGQPMDYGALAEQLYQWQRPGGRATVHRVWGRNFHARRQPGSTPSTHSATNDKDTT